MWMDNIASKLNEKFEFKFFYLLNKNYHVQYIKKTYGF